MKNADINELRYIGESNCERNKTMLSNAHIPLNINNNSLTNSLQANDGIVIEGSEKFPSLLEAIRKVDTPPRLPIGGREVDVFQQQPHMFNPSSLQSTTEETKKSTKRKYIRKSKLVGISDEFKTFSSKEDIHPNSPRKRGLKRSKKMESTNFPESSQFYNYTNSHSLIRQESYIPENLKNDYIANNINSLSQISFNPNYPFDDGDEGVRNNQIDNSAQIPQYFPDNYNDNVPQNNTNYLHEEINYQTPKQIINNTPSPDFSMYQNSSQYGQSYAFEFCNINSSQIYQPSPKNLLGTRILNDNKIAVPHTRTSTTPTQYYRNAPYPQYQHFKRENGVTYNGSDGGANNLTKNFMNNQRNMYNLNTNTSSSNSPNVMAQTCHAQTRVINNFSNTLPPRPIILGGNYDNYHPNTYSGHSQNSTFSPTTPITITNNIPINNEIFDYQIPKYETFQNVNKPYYNNNISTYIPPDTSSSSSLLNINSPVENYSFFNKYQYHNQQPPILYQNTGEV